MIAGTESHATSTTLREKPALGMKGFLAVAMVIGYEWLISGVVKLVRGDFPSGLAEELLKKSPEMAAWYGRFIASAVIPNGVLAGYAIEIAELLAGIALIVGPLVWLFAWDHVSDRVRSLLLLAMAAASIGGAFLAINLHMANAGSHPWLLPLDPNDEGIDLDSVLPALQLIIATVTIIVFGRLRDPRFDTASPRRA